MAYRILVCDDESYIAHATALYLRTQLGDEPDIQAFDSARAVLEALRLAKVDLLIADIQMPGMSGLELMREASALWPLCQVVLLTAHAAFDYAYEAIRQGNVGYVLKRSGHEALLEAVRRALSRLDHQAHTERIARAAQAQSAAAKARMQRELLLDLAHGVAYEAAELDRIQARLDLPLGLSKPMTLWVMLLAADTRAEGFLSRNERMDRLIALAAACLPEDIKLLHAPLDRQRILCVAQSEAPRSAAQWEGLLETIQHSASGQPQVPFSAVYACNVPDWGALSGAYGRINARQASMAAGDQTLWLLCATGEPLSTQEGSPDPAYANKARLWRRAFENGDPEADAQLEALLAPLRAAEDLGDPEALERYLHLGLQLCALLRSADPGAALAAGLSKTALLRPDPRQSGQEAARTLAAAARGIRALRRDTVTRSTQRMIDAVIAYIKGHLSEDISLVRLADHVGINASYLSRLFRQTTGDTLMAYITAEKIRSAYALLEDPAVRIQDISALLGYANPAYFSYFFKKNVGMTPSEYRERRGNIG